MLQVKTKSASSPTMATQAELSTYEANDLLSCD